MKLKAILAASLLTASLAYSNACGTSTYCTPVQAYGRLVAKSGALYDSSGTKKVTLRGMSMFWSSELPGYGFFNSNVVQWLQSDWQVSVIRVPLAIEKAPQSAATNKGYIDDSALNVGRLNGIVLSAVTQGLYVVIDWHCPETNPYTSKAVAFFRTMAEKYKNTPNVMFEVWNEPTVGNDQVVNHANQVISAIRATGNKNLVIVGSSGWSSQPNSIGAVTDPQSNVAYTLHFYAGASAHDAYRSNMTSAISAGRTVFVTEWGTTGADGNAGYNWGNSSTWLSALESAGVSSCNWSIANQLSNPTDPTSAVQGSAALQTTASLSGGWPDAQLTTGGLAVKGWIKGKNAGMFTPPDTNLKLTVPLAVTPNSVGAGTSVNISAQLSKAVAWTIKITGQSSNAYRTVTGNSDAVDVTWSSSTKDLASSAFSTTGEQVKIAFTSPASLVGNSTTLTVTASTTIQDRLSHSTAYGWSEQGLRVPANLVTVGETYSIRVLDLQGRQLGASRSAVAREWEGSIVLGLSPMAQAAGVSFVEIQDGQGHATRLMLPPVRP